MSLVTFLLQSSWQMMTIAALTGFVSGISSAGLIALISYAISHPLSTSTPMLLLGFLGLAAIALLTSIVSQVVLVRLSHHAVFHLRMRLIRQILASELTDLERIGNPRLLAALTEDVRAITSAVFVLPLLCIDLAIVVGCLIYITWLSWTALLLVFALMGAAVMSCIRLLRQGEKLLALAREEEDYLFDHFRSTTEGIKELKLHYQRRQMFLENAVEPTAINFRRYNIRGLTMFAASSSLGKLLFFFAVGFVLFALPKLISIQPEAISGYILAFIYLTMPMENIVNSFPVISQSNIALRKIQDLGLSLSDRSSLSSPPKAESDWHSLELRDLVYPYQRSPEDTPFVLGALDITFYPGEITFIAGGNGSGKSTFAKLLTGLYIPESGAIFLDKQPITDENREWYRQHFAVVFADFFLFERLLGLEQVNLDHLAQNYLSKLQIDHKVKIERGKLSTTALSQGQRKRLALLTAYLEDRPIYLFDEWAADQDPVFKELFYRQFLPSLKQKGKTVIVISHDDHYFHLADRLIKLDNGQVEFDR
ncbi:MAG: cyclic peptide export ABC transporter [Drouetiella hepatica Uher 2000/2452]|jgi:putative ATP-binding cassette transporter|uniref:Cyclic peptide export ABC transporter n=1 Tax=Drouetiella hepatica Uher 2000/2452 TaxID=904376 RepID=A0A951Q9F7_9CYAN|nr:cyclic peptide export ABC transporter [Drouetiella hepatica Uher 2000/2452]